MRAGFIGLGRQGLPMARRIAGAGIPTTIWARRASIAVAAAAEWHAEVAATPADLGAASDVIGVCVFDAAGVREVLFGTEGVTAGMAPGGIVAVHSTVSPDEIRDIADRAAEYGLVVLDAPVSGGPEAAAAGQLTALLAGPDDAVEEAIPLVQSYAGRIIRLPGVGAAQLAKLCNNTLLAAQVAVLDDALRIGRDHGLGNGLLEVFRAGSARGFAQDLVARYGSVDPLLSGSQFGATIAKDVHLLTQTIGAFDVGSPLLNAAVQLARRIDGGLGSTGPATNHDSAAAGVAGSNRRV